MKTLEIYHPRPGATKRQHTDLQMKFVSTRSAELLIGFTLKWYYGLSDLGVIE